MEKKCSANFLKLRSKLVYRKFIDDISAKSFKLFFKWKKYPTSNFKSEGILVPIPNW